MLRPYWPPLIALLLAIVGCGGAASSLPDTASPVSTAAPTASVAPLGTPTPGPSPAGSTAVPTAVPTPAVTPARAPTAPSPSTYTVQPGDTLYSIARRFGLTVDELAAANGIADPSRLRAGQVLVIPRGGGPTPAPPPQGSAQVVTKGNAARRMVALTFDAGADAGYTALILDTLRANGIRASFGVTGRWAEQNPDLLRRIVAEGHHLINHTYSHDSFTGRSTGNPPMTREQRWQELDRTESIVQQVTGATTKPYFRPPYGDYDASVNADVYARGYAYNVMWTVDSLGWRGIPAQEIVQRCLSLAEPGAIYIMHVGSASQDAFALQAVIDGLRRLGYSFGTVPELIAP